jgi:hypothetical protein
VQKRYNNTSLVSKFTPQLGFDTLHFFTQQFTVKTNSTFRNNRYQYKEPNLHIKRCSVNGFRFLFITTNVSRHHSNNSVSNLTLGTGKDLQRTYQWVLGKLDQIGIVAPTDSLLISRIDLALDIATSHNPQCYFKYFTPPRNTKSNIYKSTLYFESKRSPNKSKCYVYDKTKQVSDKFGVELDQNLLRFELRLRGSVDLKATGQKIQRLFGQSVNLQKIMIRKCTI